MKPRFKIYFLGLLTLIFITGCATTQELSLSISTKVSSFTSTVDPALVNQLSADKREGFAKAEFDINVAEQKVKLAELKNELAGYQKKYAGYEENLADNLKKETEIDYDIVKIGAIIKSNLGKKDENIKNRASLQSKKSEVQGDRSKIQANIEIIKGKIDDLTAEIAKMEASIKEMKFDVGKVPEKQTSAPAVPEKAVKTDKASEPTPGKDVKAEKTTEPKKDDNK